MAYRTDLQFHWDDFLCKDYTGQGYSAGFVCETGLAGSTTTTQGTTPVTVTDLTTAGQSTTPGNGKLTPVNLSLGLRNYDSRSARQRRVCAAC